MWVAKSAWLRGPHYHPGICVNQLVYKKTTHVVKALKTMHTHTYREKEKFPLKTMCVVLLFSMQIRNYTSFFHYEGKAWSL